MSSQHRSGDEFDPRDRLITVALIIVSTVAGLSVAVTVAAALSCPTPPRSLPLAV
jgi:hypothetical protein